MAGKSLQDPAKPFRGPAPVKHNGHIGPGPKPGPKRAVNVSVDAAILKVAKESGINLSKTLEDSLRKLTEAKRAQRFYDENKAYFDWHNELVERCGTLSDAVEREDYDPASLTSSQIRCVPGVPKNLF